MAIRYFTMSNPKQFRSHQWRFCTRKFFKQNCFPTDATTWMKVNGTRTVHVQGVNIFLFSHIAYQQYSYPCITKFGLTRSTSMSYISSTGGCTKTGWASKSSKGLSLTAQSLIGVVQSMYCAQGGPNDLHGHRYFTMWKPQYFRSHHWRLCTMQFSNKLHSSRSNSMNEGWMVPWYRTCTRCKYFSLIAYQPYSYPCIANFGLNRSNSMLDISSTGGCTKARWRVKIL